MTPAGMERGDPFSLDGFFPSSTDEQQWSWLLMTDEEDFDESSKVEEGFPPTPTVELDATKVIRGEDKMGILALCK
jgi:hypothetical protein